MVVKQCHERPVWIDGLAHLSKWVQSLGMVDPIALLALTGKIMSQFSDNIIFRGFLSHGGTPNHPKNKEKQFQQIESHGAIGIPILRNHNISKIRPDASLSETDYFEDPSLWISGGDGNEQKVPEANETRRQGNCQKPRELLIWV